MEAVLHGWDGSQIALPQVIQWKFQYGLGTPCDSFEVRCLWEPEEDLLAEAVGFTADEEGQRVFTGLVDECERGWDEQGSFLTISGRGMAARLLDNEALGMDYQVATWQDILRDHVTPYGLEVAGERGELPAVSPFSVRSGESEWQVLYRFARYHGGVTPRFDREGRLVLAPFADGRELVLDGETAVSRICWREKRYGVFSEAAVLSRSGAAAQRVENRPFLEQGGACRRVFTMPGQSNYLAMRYRGEFQIQRSESERNRVEVTVPRLFFAWPGDLVRLNLTGWGCGGVWRVLEARVEAGEDGGSTALTLGEPGAIIG